MKQLQQLTQQLKKRMQLKNIQNVLDLLADFEKYDGNDWKKYFANNSQSNTVLFHDDYLKLILIYWKGFQKSKLHNHPSGGGLMRVLSGRLLETRFDPYDQEKILGKFECPTGALSYIHDELALHVVENPNKNAAISLHVYAMQNGM